MSRPLRLSVPDGVFHVTARGNERRPIVRDDLDRERWTSLLGRTVERMGWRMLSYCLLDNHFHLLVATPNTNLSRGMAQLNGSYAQAFNRRHERVGHVFQGRFGATLVERDAHLLETFRYIARNPVEAKSCAEPADWRWSAHRALLGRVPAPGWLAVQEAQRWFGTTRTIAESTYAAFVSDLDDFPMLRPVGPRYGGSTDGPHPPLEQCPPEIAKRDWTARRPPLDELLRRSPGDPADAIRVAHRDHGYTLAAIAEELGCHYSTVSRRLRGSELR